jgi:hypothetical protein
VNKVLFIHKGSVMKTVYVGLVLLCMLTMACAATGNSPAASQSSQTTQQNGPASDGQVTTPAASQSGHGAAILSQGEADSLSVRGDSLLAQSNVGDIRVGEIGGTSLIYVLVVVLLVVLIIAVVR